MNAPVSSNESTSSVATPPDAPPPDLVILGNLLVDDIVFRDGRTLMGEPGGAILHAALAAALWGTRVALVSVHGNDYPSATLDALRAAGIDLAGVRPLNRPGGRAWLLHEANVRRVLHRLDCPTHEESSPTFVDIPPSYLAARAFHLAPMPLDRQQQLAIALGEPVRELPHQSSAPPLVSLDPYELVRDDNFDHWSAVLQHVDAFFPSEDEMRLTGDAATALRHLPAARLRLVALKRGVRGGRLLDRTAGVDHDWTARSDQMVDCTGAGDAFVGGFLAGLLETGDPRRGIEQGIVAASFALEDWGARGLLAATPAQARLRLHQWFGAGTASE